MKLKKLLLLLSSVLLVSLPTLTVVSCKTNKEWPILTKQEVNFKLLDIISTMYLSWEGLAIGDEGTYEWISKTVAEYSFNLLEFWIITKITAVIIDKLLLKVPNLYTLFPHFNLLVETAMFSSSTIIGKYGHRVVELIKALFSGDETLGEIHLNFNIAWSFTNANSAEFTNLMVNKELIFRNETNGGRGIDNNGDLIPYKKEEIEQWFEKQSMFIKPFIFVRHPWVTHEYYIDNILRGGHFSNEQINRLEPAENYSSADHYIYLNFQKNSNRETGLKIFVNDLSKMNTLVYDEFKFNNILEEYFFGDNIGDYGPKNKVLSKVNYPNKDYLKKLATSETDFNKYKNYLSSEYKEHLNKRLHFTYPYYKNKRLFDDVEIDFEVQKYLPPEDFDLTTKQGKINSLVFGHIVGSKINNFNNSENGVLIVKTTINFLQKDQNDNITASFPYSYDMPVFVQYI